MEPRLREQLIAEIDAINGVFKDRKVLIRTAPGFTHVGERYNRLSPFTLTWVVMLFATALLGIYAGMVRSKLIFALGMLVLLAGIAWSIYGFSMRVQITG